MDRTGEIPRGENTKTPLSALKQAELEILRAFHQACAQAGIPYSLSSGTLLGAVRHKGFIPWDDDIDVMMLRGDYERFVKEGAAYLPEYLFIQTYETDRNYPLNFCKIRDTRTHLKDRRTAGLNMQHGVFIDLFPVDRVSNGWLGRSGLQKLLILLMAVKFSITKEWAETSKVVWARSWAFILTPLARAIGTYRLNCWETWLRTWGNRMADSSRRKDVAQSYRWTFADHTNLEVILNKPDALMSMDIFEEYTELSFEGYRFSVVKDWAAYLTHMYGDYMTPPPVDKRDSTHQFIQNRE